MGHTKDGPADGHMSVPPWAQPTSHTPSQCPGLTTPNGQGPRWAPCGPPHPFSPSQKNPRHLPAGSSECQQPVRLSPPHPHAERPQPSSPWGRLGRVLQRLFWAPGSWGEEGSGGRGPQLRAWDHMLHKNPRAAQTPKHGSRGLPQSSTGPGCLLQPLRPTWGPCLPPLALCSDCFRAVGIFSCLRENFACLMTKGLFPPGEGAKPCKSSWCCR